MNSTYQSDPSSSKQDVRGLADQAGVVKEEISTLAHSAADAAKAKLSEGADYAKQQLEEAKAKAEAATKSMRTLVSDNPLSSVGIALGVGVIVGILLSRSRS